MSLNSLYQIDGNSAWRIILTKLSRSLSGKEQVLRYFIISGLIVLNASADFLSNVRSPINPFPA